MIIPVVSFGSVPPEVTSADLLFTLDRAVREAMFHSKCLIYICDACLVMIMLLYH
jgi:hypothetical protein